MEKIISQKDLFPKLIKLHNCFLPIEYPIGSYMSTLLAYTESAAQELVKLFPGDNIAFIVKGTSGAMIGGLMAEYLVHNTDVDVGVFINRKPNEDCHASNLECVESILNYDGNIPFRIVIADDFISTGRTIYNIVRAVESYINGPFIFDALVIHNKLICDEHIDNKGVPGDLRLPEEGTIAEEMLLTKFLNILCL